MRRWICAVMITLLPLAWAHAATPVALFKTAEIRADSHAGLKQWQRVLDKIRDERGGFFPLTAQPPELDIDDLVGDTVG